MAGAFDRPVHLAWAGLIGMSLSIVLIVAVRGPVFADADKQRGATSGEPTASGDEPRLASAPAKGASAQPGSSGKPGDWSLPDIPGLDDKAPAVTPGPDEREAVKGFLDRVRKNDLKGSVAALESLAADHPAAIKDPEVKEEIVELSQRVMQTTGDLPDRMFDVLARKSGTTGIDILYYLVTSKGGSKASKVADRLLADPKVFARGSEAMKVAWELRKASCEGKKALFARAGEHGDQRTLGQLFELNRSCGRRNRNCCLHKDPALEAAIDKMKERGYR